MSRDGRVDLDWGDGTYSFRLAIGQWAELQEKCDAGPFRILSRLQSGDWRFEDIVNVIRLGLIGGGMTPVDALKKVRAYVDERPPMENLLPAIGILSSSLYGAPEEPVGEQEAAEGEAKRSPTSRTGKSDLPPSTGSVPSSATRRSKSTK